jgi:twitching motility two-component system response regulator PilH
LARKILLADDSVTAQNMGRRILADAGYEVITVSNGSAALKKISEQRPDLIVLDVYMPGYGGLEVCQRIKETQDTARIPVLLTVGKLEPFKPEEAKRARADAFIVKPFEASELLTALTKLEDRIVPEARRPKGRSGKGLLEQEDGERFGDKESGWKSRLNIPLPVARAQEPGEPAQEPPAATPPLPRHVADFKPPAPGDTLEPATPASFPSDISAEEIAAIQAAAAKVVRAAEVSTRAAQPSDPIPTDAGDAVATSEETALEAGPASFRSPGTELSQTVTASEVVASEEETGGEGVSSSIAIMEAGAVQEISSEEKQAPQDQDVMAAIASLVPANKEEAATSVAVSSGPRWVAEPAALSSEDSTYVLEHEMEKTYAAIAAAEAGRAAVLEAARAEAMTLRPAAAITSMATPDRSEPPTEAASASERSEDVAYAAAASMSGTTVQVMPETPLAPTTANMDEGEKHREAQLAAAWQNWKQIRDSIVGSRITEQITDAATAELKAAGEPPISDSGTDKQVAEATAGEPSDASKADSAAIASIVDSVLAELKPKLVEEIAKKMSASKK